MYLLDTDIMIYNLKGNANVRVHLQNHINDIIRISAVTLMELYYGAYKSQQVEGNLAKVRTIENTLDIIPLDREVVEIFGSLKSKLEKQGLPLDDFDLILGATAMAHNLKLVTNNDRHFNRIPGLSTENWTRQPD